MQKGNLDPLVHLAILGNRERGVVKAIKANKEIRESKAFPDPLEMMDVLVPLDKRVQEVNVEKPDSTARKAVWVQQVEMVNVVRQVQPEKRVRRDKLVHQVYQENQDEWDGKVQGVTRDYKALKDLRDLLGPQVLLDHRDHKEKRAQQDKEEQMERMVQRERLA